MATDPLKGVRNAINKGERTSLAWPDEGKGCPVEVGQSFALRSCYIQIASTKRVRRGSKWLWTATFKRYVPERVRLLARGGGMDGRGYVDESRSAMAAQDADASTTLIELWRDNPLNLGPPPEPEGPPEDVLREFNYSARCRLEESRGGLVSAAVPTAPVSPETVSEGLAAIHEEHENARQQIAA